MKLRNLNDGLSTSLLNNSQINENEVQSQTDIIKSKLIIENFKKDEIFTKAQCNNILKKASDISISDILSVRKSTKKTVKIKSKPKLINEKENVDNSITDLVVPKRKTRNYKILDEVNIRGISTNSKESKSSTYQSTNLSISNNLEKLVSFENPSVITSNLVISSTKDSFKMPLIPNCSDRSRRSLSKKSVTSPICASSPKLNFKKRKCSEIIVTVNDTFTSEIVTSSENYNTSQSSKSQNKLDLSPIKHPNFRQLPKPKSSQPAKRSTKSMDLGAKKMKLDSLPNTDRKSAPVTEEEIFRTRSGRLSRKFSQTEIGKFIYEYFSRFYRES